VGCYKVGAQINHKALCEIDTRLFFRLAHDRAPPIFGEAFVPNFFHSKKFLKKFFYFFPKVLDNSARLWYNKDTETRRIKNGQNNF
jgi:hypothetical protein